MSNVNNRDKQSTNERNVFKLKFFNSKNVSILFLLFTILFTLLAIIIFYAQSDIYKLSLDYTNCNYSSAIRTNQFSNRTKRLKVKSEPEFRTCNYKFNLPEDSYEMVYIHYQMYDFYKNFHTFAKSFSERQLFGEFNLIVLNQCKLLTDVELDDKCAIVPCGELPNFIFNDTIQIYYELNNSTRIRIPIDTQNISESLFRMNFNNPSVEHMQIIQNNTKKPTNWPKTLFELDLNESSNNGFQNERLIVWMYPNTFSDFSKLYGRITTKFDEQIKNQLPTKAIEKQSNSVKQPFLKKGTYVVKIKFNYPLWSNRSRKGFTISTVGPFGQSNLIFKIFICLASIVSFLSMIIFYLIYRLHDNKYRLYIGDISKVDFLF